MAGSAVFHTTTLSPPSTRHRDTAPQRQDKRDEPGTGDPTPMPPETTSASLTYFITRLQQPLFSRLQDHAVCYHSTAGHGVCCGSRKALSYQWDHGVCCHNTTMRPLRYDKIAWHRWRTQCNVHVCSLLQNLWAQCGEYARLPYRGPLFILCKI